MLKKENRIVIRLIIIFAIAIVSVFVIRELVFKEPVGFPSDKISFNMSPFEMRHVLGKEKNHIDFSEWEETAFYYSEEIEGRSWETTYTFFRGYRLNEVTAILVVLDDNEGYALFEKYYLEINDFYRTKRNYIHYNYENKFEEEKSLRARFGTDNGAIGISVDIEYKDNTLCISLFNLF